MYGTPAEPQSTLPSRYADDGTLDPTFGTGGKVLTAFDGAAVAGDVAIARDGKIVAVGARDASVNEWDFALARTWRSR